MARKKTNGKRKQVGTKVRFEVFKRDSFTCQYCGASAPDVVLHVDHIKPVAEGGGNGVVNLVTSCVGCNLGKGPRELDDDTVVKKQHQQLEALQERREQLEMMMEWQRGLDSLADDKVDAISERLSFLIHGTYQKGFLNSRGRAIAARWFKKHTLEAVIKAAETSVEQYLEVDDDGAPIQESITKSVQMIQKIADVKALPESEQRLRYAKGILRKRFNLTHAQCSSAVHVARSTIEAGINDAEDIIDWARRCTSLHRFELELMHELGKAENEDSHN